MPSLITLLLFVSELLAKNHTGGQNAPTPTRAKVKTERVTAIPAAPYFWPKIAEHDVTLTSLTADLS